MQCLSSPADPLLLVFCLRGNRLAADVLYSVHWEGGHSVMEGAKVLQIEFVLVTSNALANKGVGVSFLLF